MSKTLTPSFITRTSDFAQTLVEHLQREAIVKQILPRRRLSLKVGNEWYCYLILKGRAFVHRQSDDTAIMSFSAPGLIGTANMTEMKIDGYIKTLTLCEIGILPLDKACEVIDKHALWEVLAKHMMVVSGKLFLFNQQLTAPTSYEIVREQLLVLLSEDASLRENITAEHYIRGKTNLSRSGVMRILAALREGGYIEINRGILQKVNMLPEKF